MNVYTCPTRPRLTAKEAAIRSKAIEPQLAVYRKKLGKADFSRMVMRIIELLDWPLWDYIVNR